MTWLLNLGWLLPVAYLLAMPTLDDRRRRKLEARLAADRLRFELAMLHAERGREGLEAKLTADLQQVLMNSIMRTAGGLDVDTILQVLHGEVPEHLADEPVRSPRDDWILYFWPRTRPKRRRRGKR